MGGEREEGRRRVEGGREEDESRRVGGEGEEEEDRRRAEGGQEEGSNAGRQAQSNQGTEQEISALEQTALGRRKCQIKTQQTSFVLQISGHLS